MATRAEKWADYHRRVKALYAYCWDCERPCSECRLWARETAFGRKPTGWAADTCTEIYEREQRRAARAKELR
jgi:RNA polymerase-binding transcription factor DksA